MRGPMPSFRMRMKPDLCGFEKRNRNFKGFGDLGEKGLWTSNGFPEDRRLVIGESALDCISYEVLFPCGRYASIAGGLNPKQPDLILQACEAMPAGSEVVSITHGDAEGERYAEVIRERAVAASLPFRVHRLEGVKDWNDVLKASEPGVHSFPAGR